MLVDVDWAVVIATFVGPIVAVGITLWAQARDNRKRNRMELFSNMMRSRRNPTANEFVGSLNLVPVHFHSDQTVIARYAELMAIFSDKMWRSKDPDDLRQINEKVELAIAYLLSAMSKVLGVPIEQLAILRGAYVPQGSVDEEQLNRDIRLAMRDLLHGQRFLPVLPVPPPNADEEEEISTASKPNGSASPIS